MGLSDGYVYAGGNANLGTSYVLMEATCTQRGYRDRDRLRCSGTQIAVESRRVDFPDKISLWVKRV